MSTVNLNGATINYRRLGEGKDIVLIHGLAANHAFWHLNVLLPLARKHRLSLYDLRGHGSSSMPASGYTSLDMAEDLLQLLNYLGITRADLIGHSFGGVVALHFATLHPERVSSLTVADSRVRAFQPVQCPRDWPNHLNALKRLEELGLTIPTGETEAGFWLLEKLATPEWLEKRQQLKGSQLFIPFGGWNGGQRTAERWLELVHTTTAKRDMTSVAGLTLDRLAKIQHPVLAIYGEHSVGLPSFQGLRAHLPNCRGIIVPGVGHFFPLTRPRLFAAEVDQFLETVVHRERRRHRRTVRRLQVALIKDATASLPAVTLNVSKRGLLIESQRQLKVGAELEVVIILGQEGRDVAVKGRVVRRDGGHTGSGYRFALELAGEGDSFRTWENFLAA